MGAEIGKEDSRGVKTKMKQRYLLAAGVITGLTIPATTLPALPISYPETISAHSDSGPDLLAIRGDINVTPKIEVAAPEFSSLENLDTVEDDDSSFHFNSPPSTTSRLISGSQMYYQRLSALQTGQIYTRIEDSNISSLFAPQKKRPTYEDWKALLNLEGKAIADGQGSNHLSVLVGDSLSMWFPTTLLPNGKLWLNQGISGDTSGGVSKRLTAFARTRPDVIYIMAGINDLRKGLSDEVIIRNHRRILKRLRVMHPTSLIIVQSILPTRMPTIPNIRIRRINESLAKIAKDEGASYLNIHAWFSDTQGNLREDLTTDGLHLSDRGYQVWQWAIQQIEGKYTAAKLTRQL
jgi:lysophospholipase L1-like esterase